MLTEITKKYLEENRLRIKAPTNKEFIVDVWDKFSDGILIYVDGKADYEFYYESDGYLYRVGRLFSKDYNYTLLNPESEETAYYGYDYDNFLGFEVSTRLIGTIAICKEDDHWPPLRLDEWLISLQEDGEGYDNFQAKYLILVKMLAYLNTFLVESNGKSKKE